ncbi:hypothetical protein EDD15DRAFT_1654761 [Pisolithus albus]|nr:hypothetical protein EDD15DRAFT_1654761 [Pisolithus albus]
MIDGTASSLRGSNPPADCSSSLLHVDDLPKPKPTRTGEGLIPNFPCVPNSTKHSKVCHRTHSDFVFHEACQPIYKPRSLDTVLMTLQDSRTVWIRYTTTLVLVIFYPWSKYASWLTSSMQNIRTPILSMRFVWEHRVLWSARSKLKIIC